MNTPQASWEESDGLFRLLVENIRDYAVFALDNEGRVRSWSAPAERLFGYRAPEIVGQSADRLYTPEDVAEGVPGRERRQALKKGRAEEDRWHVRKDGSRFWSGGVTTALFDQNGQPRGCAKVVRDRTDAKKAEEARDDALAYVRSIVDTLREPLLVLDSQLRVQSANRAFYENFKVSPSKTEGQLLYDLGNGQWDIPRLRRLLEEVLPDNQSFDAYEVEHDFPDIGHKSMLLNARKLRREDAELILLVIEDVTARRQAEEARRQIETRFTSLVKNVKDHSIFTLDPEGRVSSWNVAARQILGYDEAEVIGHHFGFIFTPEDVRAGMPEAELQAAREQGRAEDERWHLRKDGERFWAMGIVSALYDSGGRLTGFSKILRDMTAHKRAELALRESEERFRALTNATSDAVFHMSPDWTELLYLKGREFVRDTLQPNRSWLEKYIPPDDRPQVLEAVQRAVETRSVLELEHRVVRGDGTAGWTHSRAVPIFDEQDRIVEWFGMASDITQRKNAEQALLEADRRKNEFLATLAHELRNPLAPIRNAVEILNTEDLPQSTEQSARGMIERQVTHMVRLIDDLLDVSRITRGKLSLRKERVNLSDIVEQALEVSRPLAEAAGHDIALQLPPEPLPLNGDPARLAQVFANLLNNACKYTDPGGHVRLAAERVGDEVFVRVEDSGIGIPAGHLPHLFDLFSQIPSHTDRSQAGLGVGLSLARGLVEMHGGRIAARSEGPGRGSVFTVWLPLAPATAGKTPADRRETPARDTRPARVLVVDDMKDVAESMAMFMRLHGNEVETAGDGIEAIETAERFRPDLVLLDIGMPRLDGYGTCARMREQPWGRDLKILALTGWGQDADRRKSETAGFDGHLVKPVAPHTILELLAEYRPGNR